MNHNLSKYLLPLLHAGLSLHREKQTNTFLGDRSQYVGMSDIAKGLDCLRGVVADKLQCITEDRQIKPEDDIPSLLSQELRLQRGHWFEQGVRDVFKALDLPFIHQLEIKTEQQGVPIKAHLDFVLLFPGQPDLLQVVEVKSCEQMPQNVYASYEMQIMGQLNLLRKYWDQPCFNLCDVRGEYISQDQTFPELARQYLKTDLPEEIRKVHLEGSILMLSMSSAQVFGPYFPNALTEKSMFKIAHDIWRNLQQVSNDIVSLNDLPIADAFHPLCDWCDHNAACPRFSGIEVIELESELQALQALKQQKQVRCLEIKTREERLKKAFLTISPHGEWVNAQTYRCKVITANQCTFAQRLYISPIKPGAKHHE